MKNEAAVNAYALLVVELSKSLMLVIPQIVGCWKFMNNWRWAGGHFVSPEI